jgi:hypothetical protein
MGTKGLGESASHKMTEAMQMAPLVLIEARYSGWRIKDEMPLRPR